MIPRRAERHGERVVGIALLLMVFAWHAAILLQQPVVGTAENGDFWRVAKPAGIVSLDVYEAVDHKFVSQTYGVAEAHLGVGSSSAAVIAAGAKLLGLGRQALDIRQVGAAYLGLFAVAFALALAAGVPAVLCALLAWAALDVSYSLYFNSFFADPAALLGVLGIVLTLIAWSDEPSPRRRAIVQRALLLLAALVAAFSKNLYMLTPFFVAGVVAVWPCRRWAAHLRAAVWLLAALALGGVLAVWHFTYGGGYRFPDINNHHAVFRGLTAVADDPAEVLGELGIDPRYAAFAGKTFFDLGADERKVSIAALQDLSHVRLALAYLRHPRRLGRAVAPALQPLRETTTPDPNFSDRTRPPAVYRGWWQFAQLRGRLYPLACAMLGAGLIALAYAARTRTWRGAHAALAFLLLNAAMLVILSVLGDGFFGLRRHTLAARFSLDLALALIAYAAYGWLRDRRAVSGARRAAQA